jgi:glyoxylase-like metal-dependent hydrolase (beta-lactamase superfamily II)
LTRSICTACGTCYPGATDPPEECAVCTDDRQYVPATGQRWTTPEELAEAHSVKVGTDDDTIALMVDPPFAIAHRALLARSPGGNLLWESLSLVTDEAVAELERHGGVDAIAISHPHFYAAMLEWSEALGAVPIFVHEADRQWLQATPPIIELWSGDRHELWTGMTLLNLPGHFPGSSALLWADGPHGPALLTGDSLQVAADRNGVCVMHSYPNAIPVSVSTIDGIRARLADVSFVDIYGYAWGRNIIGGAREIVDRSLARHHCATTT